MDYLPVKTFLSNVNRVTCKNNFLTFFKVGTIIASCNMWFGLKYKKEDII